MTRKIPNHETRFNCNNDDIVTESLPMFPGSSLGEFVCTSYIKYDDGRTPLPSVVTMILTMPRTVDWVSLFMPLELILQVCLTHYCWNSSHLEH